MEGEGAEIWTCDESVRARGDRALRTKTRAAVPYHRPQQRPLDLGRHLDLAWPCPSTRNHLTRAVPPEHRAGLVLISVETLRGSPACEVIALQPLSEDEVQQLVCGLGRVSASTDAERLASRIHEVTAGYPFYIVELLKTLFAQGWLSVDPESGEWIVRPSDSGDEPALALPSVHEAIAERIECLSDELKGVLITIAVSTRGCRTDVLSHVHGVSRLRAAAIGDALVERHLVIEDNGAYRCAHPVIGRVMVDELGTSRKREVHRGLALAMELVGSDRVEYVDPGEIARHAEQAGERATAYRFAMQAVEACERRLAFDDALGWLDFASGVATTATDADAVNPRPRSCSRSRIAVSCRPLAPRSALCGPSRRRSSTFRRATRPCRAITARDGQPGSRPSSSTDCTSSSCRAACASSSTVSSRCRGTRLRTAAAPPARRAS